MSLIVVVLSFYKVVRNFNRPVPPSVQQLAQARLQAKLNFVNAMNLLQEQVSRVFHNKDLSEVEIVSQRVGQTPPPDSRAAELRDRLMDILTRLTAAGGNREQLEKLNAEYQTWQKDYEEWFKGVTNGD
jgi:hypothetical protein